MNAIIQDIMKIDLKEFSKQSQQKRQRMKSNGASSTGTAETGSVNQNQARRVRQGTPVNIKTSQETQYSNPSSQQQSSNLNMQNNFNLQQ